MPVKRRIWGGMPEALATARIVGNVIVTAVAGADWVDTEVAMGVPVGRVSVGVWTNLV